MAAMAWQTLTPQAKGVAQRLFTLYDADKSGTIENPEFMSLCRAYDATVDATLVKQSFQSVAGPTVLQQCMPRPTPLYNRCVCVSQGLDVQGLAMWMMNAFGATEQAFCQAGETLIRNTGPGVDTILPAIRQKRAQRLFKAYDADSNSFIDITEFTTLCKEYDTQIDEAGVRNTFEMVGASDGRIDIVAFYRWIQMMFGECSDTEFDEGMEDLLMSASVVADTNAGDQIGLSGNSRRWANKLFKVYDKDASGDMSIAEFTGLCRKYDPTMSEASVQLTFETSGAVGGKITLQQFLQWCVTMFGTDDGPFEDSIRELLSESADAMSRMMPASRRQLANHIFRSYDADNSGYFDLQEFTFLYRSHDSSSSDDLIRRQFETAGGGGAGMNLECFENWLMIQFGELSDTEFERQVQPLLNAAALQVHAKSKLMADGLAQTRGAQQGDSELQKRMQLLQADIVRFEAQKSKLEQDTAVQQENFLSKQNELQQLQSAVIPLTQRKNELEQSVMQHQQGAAQMEAKLQALQNALMNQQTHYDTVTKDGESKVLNSARQVDDAESKIKTLESQLSTLNSEVAQRAIRSDQLKKDLENLELEKSKRQEIESEMTAKERAFTDAMGNMQKQQGESSALLDKQREELEAMQLQVKMLQQERATQESIAAQAREDAEAAAAKRAQEESRIAELELVVSGFDLLIVCDFITQLLIAHLCRQRKPILTCNRKLLKSTPNLNKR